MNTLCRHRRSTPLILVSSLALAACTTVGPDFKSPAAPAVAVYTARPLLAATSKTPLSIRFDSLDNPLLPLFTVTDNPEQLLSRKQDGVALNAAIERLPATFREVLILRELEELSYNDIARIVGIPAGTVMSRLSRARALLRGQLSRAD